MSIVIWEELERNGYNCILITVVELLGGTEKDKMVSSVTAIF